MKSKTSSVTVYWYCQRRFFDMIPPLLRFIGTACLLQAGFGLFVKQHPLEPGREVATEGELLR